MFPSVQYGVPETFDDDLFVSVAHTSNSSLQFYNVCGGIKFSLSRDDITSVSFRGNDGEDLAGEISVTFVNGLPKATVLNGVKEVTLTPKTGQTFAKDVNYYLIVLPGTLSKGFTMTFTTSSGLAGVLDYTEKAITIKRSIFSRKAKIDSYAKFDDEPSNIILYTSTDGKIITPYASDVFGANIISNEYVNGQGVITFDGSVKRIGTYAFYGCSSLTSVSIPSSVSSIGAYAFNRCISLTSIIIPSSVTSIDPTAFYRCGSLSSIIVDSNNRYYDSRNSCNAIIQTETNELISGCKNSIIPSSVTGIGAYAFDGCSSLTSILIPTSVTSIGYSAFRECSSLTSIIIPSSVSSIGACLFIGCDSLSSIIVDSNNRYYDSRNSCNAIIQTETNELISGCKNSVIPSSVTSIGDSAFMECSNLKSVTIPTSVTRIGSSTFRGCSSLTSIIIPSSVTSIGDSAFKECDSLTSITISSSVTGIGPYAFENCISLKSIIIPSSVTFIGTQAFYHCNALSYITILAVSPPGSGPEIFHYTNNCPIYVPAGYVEAYKTAVYWSSYADRIQAVSTSPVPDAIDLGLPSGLKWASFNVGASKPEEYGDYFAWGETVTKTNYSWSTYKWCNGTSNTLTKYNSIASNGTIDNKFLLEETDDVANVKLGGKWRMPTDAEWKELQDNCSWIWTTKNSIRGRLVTSNKNGASIFLPAAGYWFVTDLNNVGSTGLYWSSSLDYTNYPDAACFLLFDSGNVNRDINGRDLGFSVRPVYGDSAEVSVTGVSLNKASMSMTVGETQTLTATVTPSNATNKSVTWSSNNTSVAMVSSSGVVTAKAAGSATITVTTNDGGKTATCSVTVSQSGEVINLSAEGTANSYIINKAGTYKINGSVKGNSMESVGKPVSASAIWETFNTSTVPSVGDVIRDVSFSNGFVQFSSTGTKGNALIAVKDSENKVLWSWHIWVTDYNPDSNYCRYLTGAIMMDRDLGALSSKPEDSFLTNGLLYQWGRKDPFLNYAGCTGPKESHDWFKAKSSTDVEDVVETSRTTGTIDYSIQNPSVIIQGKGASEMDWLFYERDNSLWQTNKTKYDPCPPGWRVPTGAGESDWINPGTDSKSEWAGFPERVIDQWDEKNMGVLFGPPYSTPATWYHINQGAVNTYDMNMWTCSTDELFANYVTFTEWTQKFTWWYFYGNGRYNQFSIRCTKE